MPVDFVEYNIESPSIAEASIQTTPLESHINSQNGSGAWMEEIDRATSSRARRETPLGMKHHKKKDGNSL